MSGEALRVLQVVTVMNRGGLETFLMNIYRAIDRGKVQFDFLVHRDCRGDYDDEIESLGGRIYHIRRQNPLDPRYWRALNAFFLAHPYKVVHAQLDCLSAEPLAVAAKYGAVVRVAHSHNSCQDKDFKYPLKMMFKPMIKQEATHLFACGVDAGKWMFGIDDFQVIKNAIDIDAYVFNSNVRNRVRTELGIAPGVFVVGHVGRFDAVKNHAFLIEVFAELLAMRPDSVLLLAGDGSLRSDIEGQAERLGVSSSVRFLGSRSDVPELMQAMDCFIMPSLYEGLPMVLVEAQGAGLPCLISDTIPEDCDIPGGSIMRASLSDSAEEWAKRVADIRANTSNRSYGAQAISDAGFDAKATASCLQNFYISALKEEVSNV